MTPGSSTGSTAEKSENHRVGIDMKKNIFFDTIKDTKLLTAISLGSLGLSLWQTIQTLFSLFPSLKGPLGLPFYLISGLAGFAVLTMLPGHFIRMIKETAADGHYRFNWRQWADIQNGLLPPLFKFILICFWSFLPVELYLALAAKNHNPAAFWTAAILAGLSLVYFPMALLLMAVTGKIMPSLLPSNVIEPIFKTFKSYLMFLLPFWVVCLTPFMALLLWPIPVIGPLLASFILLYLWTCGMKLLGNFYHMHKDALKWQ